MKIQRFNGARSLCNWPTVQRCRNMSATVKRFTSSGIQPYACDERDRGMRQPPMHPNHGGRRKPATTAETCQLENTTKFHQALSAREPAKIDEHHSNPSQSLCRKHRAFSQNEQWLEHEKHRCTDAQKHRYTDAQMHRCTDAQMRTCRHAHMHTCTYIDTDTKHSMNASTNAHTHRQTRQLY